MRCLNQNCHAWLHSKEMYYSRIYKMENSVYLVKIYMNILKILLAGKM